MVVERPSSVAKLCLQVFTAVLLTSVSSSVFAAALPMFKDNGNRRELLGHTPMAALATSSFQRAALSNETMDLQVMIPLKNQGQLDDLVKGLYDSTSAAYHKFLTADQFNQQFRASDNDITTAQQYFSNRGFKVLESSPNGTVLHIRGPVEKVNKTFGVQINYYKNTDGTLFFAPNTNPVLLGDSNGVPNIVAVGGMDNLIKFKPHLHQAPQAVAMVGARAIPKIGSFPFPGGSTALTPSDIKKAYNMNAIPVVSNDPGSLQNIALFELDGYFQNDIVGYEAKFSLPTNSNSTILKNVLIDGFNGVPTTSGGSDEVTIDVEQVLGTAFSSIKQVLVYEAPNTWQGWMDEWSRIANDNTAKIISCSWGIAESQVSSSIVQFDKNIFTQMAAQGQEVFVASGDCGAFADCTSKTVVADEPSAQANVTGVGITAVALNSDGSYNTETGSTYGGGGVSRNAAIPSYQQAMAAQATSASMVSKTMRNVPDVALTADSTTLYAYYVTLNGSGAPNWYGFWGSSISAPVWAAFLAQVNQARVHAGYSTIGFINPAIYSLANSVRYSTDFHDVTGGFNQYYPAQVGFDNVTGLGSFNGTNLFSDLLVYGTAVPLPAAPTGLSASAGSAMVALSWAASSGATSYAVKRSTTSGGPYTTVMNVTQTSYTDTSVVNGLTYYYVVSAVNSAGSSANSSQVTAKPVLPAPLAPSVVIPTAGNGVVTLVWASSAYASSYNIKRSTVSGGPYTTVANVVTTSFNDSSVVNGTTYYYVVTAVNATAQSGNSAQVSATPTAAKGIAAPTNLKGSATSYAGRAAVLLQWSQSNTPTTVVSNNIYMSVGSAKPSLIGQIGATTAVIVTYLNSNTTYNFYVTAVNGKLESVASNTVTLITNR